MKDLHNVFLLGMAIHNRKKINAARKVTPDAAAAATADAAIATSTLQIPPYLHMPLQWIHLHLL
jgi:hypothetical protein